MRGGALGLGLLLGAMVFAFGNAAGCRKAEILAINDDGELLFFSFEHTAGVHPSGKKCRQDEPLYLLACFLQPGAGNPAMIRNSQKCSLHCWSACLRCVTPSPHNL